MVGGLPLKKNDFTRPGIRKLTYHRLLHNFE
jgi:hypothetical protein